MTENQKKFLEAASKNEELRKKINEMDQKTIIVAAKELGIELSEADFIQPDGELNADELEAVTGGGKCECVAGGGGTRTGEDDVCACVMAGAGFYDAGGPRCECFIIDEGVTAND